MAIEEIGAKPQNRLVIRLVAIQATPGPELPWHVTGYDDKHGHWQPCRRANAAYRAAEIGYAGLTRERKNQQAIRDLIEEAFTAGAFSTAVPLVIFADGEACSGIWPGLNNSSLRARPAPWLVAKPPRPCGRPVCQRRTRSPGHPPRARSHPERRPV